MNGAWIWNTNPKFFKIRLRKIQKISRICNNFFNVIFRAENERWVGERISQAKEVYWHNTIKLHAAVFLAKMDRLLLKHRTGYFLGPIRQCPGPSRTLTVRRYVQACLRMSESAVNRWNNRLKDGPRTDKLYRNYWYGQFNERSDTWVSFQPTPNQNFDHLIIPVDCEIDQSKSCIDKSCENSIFVQYIWPFWGEKSSTICGYNLI